MAVTVEPWFVLLPATFTQMSAPLPAPLLSAEEKPAGQASAVGSVARALTPLVLSLKVTCCGLAELPRFAPVIVMVACS